MRLRFAKPSDREQIKEISLTAFEPNESALVTELALALHSINANPPCVFIVIEIGNVVVGYVAFSPLTLAEDKSFLGYILAPLAVAPNHQGKGMGARLVEHGLSLLQEQNVAIVFVYGDPNYYGRFGFDAKGAECFHPPYPLREPFGWQSLVLNPEIVRPKGGSLGCVAALQKAELW